MLFMFKPSDFDKLFFSTEVEIKEKFKEIISNTNYIEKRILYNISHCLLLLRHSNFREELILKLYNVEHVSYSFNYVARAILPFMINNGLEYDYIKNNLNPNLFFIALANFLLCEYKFGEKDFVKLSFEGYETIDSCITNMYFFVFQSLINGKKYFFILNTKEFDIGDPEKMNGCIIK